MLEKIMECLTALLPFLRKKGTAKEVKEFSDLVTGQYAFLMEQLEKVLKDYFELSTKIKEMHSEVILLKEQLAESLSLQCKNRECGGRR